MTHASSIPDDSAFQHFSISASQHFSFLYQRVTLIHQNESMVGGAAQRPVERSEYRRNERG